VLPPARRTASGYRVYTEVHAAALDAYLALIPAYGHAAARTIMWAVHRGDLDGAFQAIDAGHAQLIQDRRTLDAVQAAAGVLVAGPAAGPPQRPVPVGAVAHRLGITAAALRKWELAGVLTPRRDRSGHRVYGPDDVRDAELAHLLRRGGYPLGHIATVVRQVREAGGAEALAGSLAGWRDRLTRRGRAMLTAAARLDVYLSAGPGASA
jgi:DNA-binding transcriptional MerR regulator